MNRTVFLAALACLALPAPAARATSTADEFGFTCGFMSTNDPAGLVDPDPDRQYGTVNGGPVSVLSDGPPIISVTITCTIQVNAYDHSGPDAASVSATGSGNTVVLPPTAMTYRAQAADNVVLCTRVDWVTRDGTGTWYYDADDWLPGDQCDDGTGTGV